MNQSRIDERRTQVRAARLSTIRCLRNINDLLKVYEDTGILEEALLYAAVHSIQANVIADLGLARRWDLWSHQGYVGQGPPSHRRETRAEARERLERRAGRDEGV